MPRRAMVPADQEDRIAKVEAGEKVFFLSQGANDVAPARPKCDKNNGRWYCATHRKRFENQLQKDIHIDTGKHRLAWVCFEHGIEVP